MILTVTLNPALDRTMTVPNFQAGLRHRATETVILPGGKGINVARAAKALGRPVIATGFIGGRKGDQIVSDLNDEGILCDFVRVAGESRISTAVVDPTTGVVTEINEQGPELEQQRPGCSSREVGLSGQGRGCGGVRRQHPAGTGR